MSWRGHHGSTAGPIKPEPRALWLIPLAVAAAYLVVLLAQLPHDITELAWDSDYASGFTMPETLIRTGTSGHTVVGSSGQWVSLWFGLLTARLPLHRQLWGIAPTLLFVVTALTVGWSVARVADRRAAILAVLLAVIASPLALAFFLAPVAHNALYPCTALVGVYLVWLSLGRRRGRVCVFAVPALMGVVVGACLASDLLVAAAAAAPLTLTALLALARRDRRSRLLGASALGTVAVAIPVALLTSSIMSSQGFVTVSTPAKAVALAELPERAELLFKGLKALFNGFLGPGAPGTLHAELGIASDVVMSAALLTLIAFGVLTTVGFIRSGLRKSAALSPIQLARAVHVVYWVTSGACVCGAFWIAAETGGGTNLHESYYATVVFSVAAVIPLLLSSGALARLAIAAAATVFFVSSLVALTGDYTNISAWIGRDAPSVTRIALANHVTVGYGGWGESSLTWNTDGRVVLRPVMECPNPSGPDICPFYQGVVPSWYVPQRRRSFMLVDSEEPWISSLPRGLGKPLASYRFGAMSMYIYPYDIASRLGPAPD